MKVLTIKNSDRISVETGKKLATNMLKNQGTALEISAKVSIAAAIRNLKAALSTLPEVIKFCHKGRGLYLGKFAF